MKVHMVTISIILILGAFSITQGYGTSSNRGIDWMKVCQMAPDVLVSEPCDELVTDYNELTSKGERVLACIGGGALAIITQQYQLLGLAPAVGCGGSGSSSGSGLSNLLSNLLN